MSEDHQQEGENNNNNEVEVQEEEPRAYEITATDHINKSMLESFKSHLENSTIKVPENDIRDEGEWDD